MRSVALDLGAKKIAYCEVAQGAVIRRSTVGSIEALVELLGPSAPPARVAIEACREAWAVTDLLEGWGNAPILVDTTRVRRIGVGDHGRKTDRLDAEALARALDKDALPQAHLLSAPNRSLRMLVMMRAQLVETRAQYIAQVRALARASGKRLPSCAADDFGKNVTRMKMDDQLRALVAPMTAIIAPLDQQIVELDARLENEAPKTGPISTLTTAPGVGIVVAATFVSVIDDPQRFKNAHKVGSYLGLVPNEDSSGGRRRLGSITKRGNTYLRAMLVQAAWNVLRLRKADPLKEWGLAIAKRRGKKIAAIAIARRLATILWAMWCDGTDYAADRVTQPVKGARRSGAAN